MLCFRFHHVPSNFRWFNNGLTIYKFILAEIVLCFINKLINILPQKSSHVMISPYGSSSIICYFTVDKVYCIDREFTSQKMTKIQLTLNPCSARWRRRALLLRSTGFMETWKVLARRPLCTVLAMKCRANQLNKRL